MSKIWGNNVKVIRKSNLKQRQELKLTAFVVKNLYPNFQNLASPGKLRAGGPAGVSKYFWYRWFIYHGIMRKLILQTNR